MPPLRLAPILALLLLLMGCGAAVVGAGDETREPASAPAATGEGWSPAAIDYAAAIDPDMDMAEAGRRANLMTEVRPTLASIRGEASDTLAGLWFEHEPDLSVHLRLTADPSPDLASIIDSSPVPIIVHPDAGMSDAEARRRMKAALPSLHLAIPELQGTYVDERTGEAVLDIFVDGTEGEVTETKARIEEAVTAFTRETQLPVRTEYLRGPVTMGALTGGELVIEGRCAYVVHAGQTRTLLVFSAGVVSWKEGAVILRNRTERFEAGDRVLIGGGEVSYQGKSRANGEPDDSCDTQKVWMTSTYSVRLAPED